MKSYHHKKLHNVVRKLHLQMIVWRHMLVWTLKLATFI